MIIKKNIILIVCVVVLTAGLGFYLGTLYQQGKQSNRLGFPSGQPGFQGRNINAKSAAFKPIIGEIISVDGTSITVKLSDGTSRIILYSVNTNINKAEKVSAAVLAQGNTIRIFGIVNTDGSVTAQDIQLNPQQEQIDRGR